MDSYKVNLYTR